MLRNTETRNAKNLNGKPSHTIVYEGALFNLLNASDMTMVNNQANYTMSTYEDRPFLIGLRFDQANRVDFDTTQRVQYLAAGYCLVKSVHGVEFRMEFHKFAKITLEDVHASMPKMKVPVIEVAPQEPVAQAPSLMDQFIAMN